MDTNFSASKLQWLMDNSDECKRAVAAGTLMAGTIDTWVIWNLTNRGVFATDHSNASRTLLYNIETCEWDDELRAIFNVTWVQLPEVRFADQSFGTTTIGDSLVEIPICGVVGDSHAALFGHAGFTVGEAKTALGTGSSVMMNVGPSMLTPPVGVVSSIAWGVQNTVSYVLEGNIHSTGNTVRWVRDQLGLFSDYADTERRAALENIAFQVHDVISTMTSGGGVKLPALRADGGPTGNRFLMQFLADILGVTVRVGEIEEISARGVAFAAGLATGSTGVIGSTRHGPRYRGTFTRCRAKLSQRSDSCSVSSSSR